MHNMIKRAEEALSNLKNQTTAEQIEQHEPKSGTKEKQKTSTVTLTAYESENDPNTH